ncbi:MAG: FAD-dependent oxidoreductase, partial [Candidatus Eisenbacteria bacterium]
GQDRVQAVRLEGARGAFSLPVAGLVIKVGVLPNTEWCRGAVECDPDGYPFVDERLATSHPRAWAAAAARRPPPGGPAVAAVGRSLRA